MIRENEYLVTIEYWFTANIPSSSLVVLIVNSTNCRKHKSSTRHNEEKYRKITNDLKQ